MERTQERFCLPVIARGWLLVLLFLFCANGAFAQSKITVTGTVYDELDMPVISATVVVVGQTNKGAITDLDGNFTIKDVPSDAKLSISYVGYKTLMVEINGRQNLTIKLEPDAELIEEVVVIGYGTQKKATLTGAISTIDTKDLRSAPVASISNVLAGSMPGVSSIQNSGKPGQDAAQIFVRGMGSLNANASAPLVLVDGVERDFSQIDPNEIESFSVLKDAASTAVFGVRGANGVILVTTRRGATGEPTISIASNTGFQMPMNLVRKVGSYEHALFWNDKFRQDEDPNPQNYFTPEMIENFRTGNDPLVFPNSDWSELLFKKGFLQTNHNINISGGNDFVKYFVSMGYLFQDGILKQYDIVPYNNNYSFNRYNYRANLDLRVSPTTQAKINIGGLVSTRQEPITEDGVNNNAFVYATIWTTPMAGSLHDGVITLSPRGFFPQGIEMKDGFSGFFGRGYRNENVSNLNIDFELNQNLDFLTKGLSASVKGAYDNRFVLKKERNGGGVEKQVVYYKTFLENNHEIPMSDPDFDKTVVFVPSGQETPLGYAESGARGRNWYLEAKLDYNRTFADDHAVTALFLYNQTRKYYPQTVTYIPRGYVGFVGRLNYTYRNKYMFDLNAGYNGSENFAPGKTRYGLFPSASLAWVMTEEDFMKKQTFIDYLKFRVSIGKVGNDIGTTRFMYSPAVWTPSGSYNFGTTTAEGLQSYAMGRPGNPNVTWETSTKQNYAADLNIFDNRLRISADVFYEMREGILISPNSTPGIIATPLPNLNLGKVENKGYEISLKWNDHIGKNFNYFIHANLSHAKNKIIYMDEVKSDFWYQNQTGYSTGRNNDLYLYDRLYRYDDFHADAEGNIVLNSDLPVPAYDVRPGDAKYIDRNGDGKVDAFDKGYAGYSTLPEYILGLNAGFDVKGVSFAMQWTGAANVNKMLGIEYRIPFTNAGGRGLLDYFWENSWREGKEETATLPRPAEKSESWNSENSTLWLRDASYLRLKTVRLGYTFDHPKFLQPVGVKRLDITLSGYNLLTFTPLKEMDPETVANNQGNYPLVKTVTLGLNINF
ncbi:MAG: TonB-dependent receptor [Porphyromonas sp.]|nr:TonB-dependent receptor [Bacteroidales bacterium]MDY3100696.1 TonB-dependent receptor [Porphyromonas sp.]